MSSIRSEIILKRAFGVNEKCTHIRLLGPDVLLYSISNHLCLVDMREKTQEIIAQSYFRTEINCLEVSVPRDLIVVCEEAAYGNPSTITLMSATSPYEIKKTLSLPCKKNICSLALSSTGRFLAAQGVSPLNQIIVYRMDSDQIVGQVDFHLPINCISFSPVDENVVCVSGLSSLMFLKRGGKSKFEESVVLENIEKESELVSHLWNSDTRLLVSCANNKVLIIDNGTWTDTVCISPAFERKRPLLCPFLPGFVSVVDSFLAIYNTVQSGSPLMQRFNVGFEVNAIAKQPNSDAIILMGKDGSCFRFIPIPLNRDPETKVMQYTDTIDEIFQSGSHHGPITSLSVCTQRSLALTCNSSCLSLWNCLDNQHLFSSWMDESPASVCLSPLGLHLLIAFKTCVSLYSVTNDKIIKSYDVLIDGVTLVAYSSTGAYFACFKAGILAIYDAVSYRILFEWKTSHAIRKIRFSEDDRAILLISNYVTIFDMPMLRPVAECRGSFTVESGLLNWSYKGSGNHELIVSTSDCYIRVLSLNNDILIKTSDSFSDYYTSALGIHGRLEITPGLTLKSELEMPEIITALYFCADHQLLVAGSKYGTAFVLTANPVAAPIFSVQIHAGPVMDIWIHPVSLSMVSIGWDGVVIVSDIDVIMPDKTWNSNVSRFKGESNLGVYTVAEVDSSKLNEERLQREMDFLNADTKEKMSVLALSSESTICSIKSKLEEEKIIRKQLEERHKEELRELSSNFKIIEEALESKFNAERNAWKNEKENDAILLHTQYLAAKSQLEIKLENMRAQMENTVASHNSKINALTSDYESKIMNLEKECSLKQREIESLVIAHEHNINRLESEYEAELEQVHDAGLATSNLEALSTAKAISTMTVAVRQYEATQSIMDQFQLQVETLESENAKYKLKIEFLNTEILRAKQYIKTRDADIVNKQKEIALLSEKLVSKDAVRKVVDIRVKSFEELEEPRMQYITGLLSQINTLEQRNFELYEESSANKDAVLQAKSQITSLESTVSDFSKKLFEKTKYFDMFLSDFRDLYDESLKLDSNPSHDISKLYDRYRSMKLIEGNSINLSRHKSTKKLEQMKEQDAKLGVEEVLRQRDFLTKKVEQLTSDLKKSEKQIHLERNASVHAQSAMSEELTQLQIDNKRLQLQISELQSRLYRNKSEDRLKHTSSKQSISIAGQSPISENVSAVNISVYGTPVLATPTRPPNRSSLDAISASLLPELKAQENYRSTGDLGKIFNEITNVQAKENVPLDTIENSNFYQEKSLNVDQLKLSEKKDNQSEDKVKESSLLFDKVNTVSDHLSFSELISDSSVPPLNSNSGRISPTDRTFVNDKEISSGNYPTAIISNVAKILEPSTILNPIHVIPHVGSSNTKPLTFKPTSEGNARSDYSTLVGLGSTMIDLNQAFCDSQKLLSLVSNPNIEFSPMTIHSREGFKEKSFGLSHSFSAGKLDSYLVKKPSTSSLKDLGQLNLTLTSIDRKDKDKLKSSRSGKNRISSFQLMDFASSEDKPFIYEKSPEKCINNLGVSPIKPNDTLPINVGKIPIFPTPVYPNQTPVALTTINNHPTHSRFPAMPSTFIKNKTK